MSKYFCPDCGAAIAPKDKFCQNCGANTGQQQEEGVKAPISQKPISPQPQRSGPVPYQQQTQYQPSGHQPVGYPPGYVGRPADWRPVKADIGSRCVALLVDSLLWGLISSCSGFGACIAPFKDSIPEAGKSFGKKMMNIKIVDYDTGREMSVGQGCARNLGYCVTLGFDYFVPLCTEDGRRVGDYIAGTIVIEDR